MIEQHEVKTYVNILKCDICKSEMQMSSTVLAAYPPIYQYNCPNCGNAVQDARQFPHFTYEKIK